MVNFATAATFLALTNLFAATAISNAKALRPKNLRRNNIGGNDNDQTNLRNLYGADVSDSHFISDTVTECEEIVAGNPPVCIKVCTEVTSIMSGETLVDETSKVNQSKCVEKTIVDEPPTYAPAYQMTKLEDEETSIITQMNSPYVELAEEEDAVTSSEIYWVGDGYTSTSTSDLKSIVITNGEGSTKSSKGGGGGSKGSAKIASFSAKSSKSEFTNNAGGGKSSKSNNIESNVAVTTTSNNGWSGSVQTASDNISPTWSGKSSKYAATYTEQVELETNSWAGSAQSTGILGESGSKSDKSAGVTSSAGGKGSSKSSKSEGSVDTATNVVVTSNSNGWSGSLQVVNDNNINKSSKYLTYPEHQSDVLDASGWYSSAQSTTIIGGDSGSSSSSKSDKTVGVTSSVGGNGSSKSSKSEGSVESVANVATSNGWSGSAQEYNTVSTATSSGKSSKMEYSNNSYATNGGDSKGSTVSVSSSSKGGKGYGTGEAAHVEIKYVAISKPQSTNGWQSDGWQP